MAFDIDKIEGDKLLDLFNKLIQEQTFIKVCLPKSDFESLTVLTDMKSDSHNHLFQIDIPEGIGVAMRTAPSKTMNFEFAGKDHITHRFEALLHQVTENSLWLILPVFIRRFQMRDNFRLRVHRDSFATIAFDQFTVRMKIDNLSVGGVYCYCANKHKSLFQVDSKLNNMTLNITARRDCILVEIDQVLVKRIEPWMEPKHFGVAFEFVQIQKTIRQQLIRHIYNLQRDFLQGRIKTD